jgi:hypothetical protein
MTNPSTEVMVNRKIGAHWTPSNLTTLIEWLWSEDIQSDIEFGV